MHLKIILFIFIVIASERYTNAIKCKCSGLNGFPSKILRNFCDRTGICEYENGACYKTVESADYHENPEVIRKKYGDHHESFGCTKNEFEIINGAMCQTMRTQQHLKVSKCCFDGDMCNEKLNVSIIRNNTNENSNRQNKKWEGTNYTIVIVVLIVTIIIVLLIILTGILLLNKKAKKELRKDYKSSLISNNTSETLADLYESGSGSGLPLLVQMTFARQITLEKCIGKGKYGEVYLGRWRSDDVAVKIFSSRDELSWRRETMIYRNYVIRHDNILGFIASDNKDTGITTQLWLVTEYHPLGSLFDVLQAGSIDEERLVDMALTSMKGLLHLHTEIESMGGSGHFSKVAIAHRDIKSRNILVKQDGRTCCIADLGLAVMHDEETNSLDVEKNNYRVGTKRYMSPECLNNTLDISNFDCYKQSDIYSMGLVFWELLKSVDTVDNTKEVKHELPYFDTVPNDPSIEDMQEVVCIKQIRPKISPLWQQSNILNKVSNISKECWYENPVARLTSLRIKKSLQALKYSDIEKV